MPKVSVLMPVYNTKEEFLRESIESILHQTFQEFELIILDDGSSNDVESIVRTYKDTRIGFYKNEQNLGVAKTRNKLLDLAKGEYCAFQDADDISLPERLEKQVKFLDENREIYNEYFVINLMKQNRIINSNKNLEYTKKVLTEDAK